MEKGKIKSIYASETLDIKGNPTIEIEVITSSGISISSSIGCKNFNSSIERESIFQTICEINDSVATELVNKYVFNQQELDNIITLISKDSIGNQEMLCISMAIAKAAAFEINMPLYRYLGGINATNLPRLMINILNLETLGKKIYEYMIIPRVDIEFELSVKMCIEVFHNLKSILKERGISVELDDDGRFILNSLNNEQVLDILREAIKKSGYKLGEEIFAVNDESLQLEKEFENIRLINLSQMRTLSEVLELIKNAQNNREKIVISNEFQKTTDTFIADLAVAVNADYIKIGLPFGGERIEKYNRLLKINDMLR